MKPLLPLALAIAAPAFAQAMGGMDMHHGMAMPMPEKKKPAKLAKAKTKKRAKPAHGHATRPANAAATAAMPAMDMSAGHMAQMKSTGAHQGAAPQHDMGSMPGMAHGAARPGQPMAGMDMTAAPTGTDLPAGNAAAPEPPMDHYADRTYGHAPMEHGRHVMMREGGGQIFHQLMFNLAEFQARSGGNGYRWDGEAWIGGDRNRLWLKSEGEGSFRAGVDSAEIQALYARAIGPYFNLQAGVRYDLRPQPRRAYATVGFEGLAPYNFETEGALFLSTKGDLLARLEGWYDQRLTQRLVLQPRAELNFSAQDVPEDGYGAGLIDAELGLRLRYELRREFAPYVGISWEKKAGRSAHLARARGEDTGGASLVAGLRFWF